MEIALRRVYGSLILIGTLTALAYASIASPLALHPENPHYFLYKGEPTVLVTSGEHYGAVLNLDFDYKTYFRTLHEDGLNNTRTFSGAYVEPQGAFNIARNTLAPGPHKFICPWARSGEPGYTGGGNKFDLTKWNQAYFERLRDFVATAAEYDVIVEMNLFCPFYGEEQWKLSPQNTINNINGISDIERTQAYTLDKNGNLLKFQEEMTQKIVTELNQFDNLYYEICNEPYFGGVTMEWQYHIAEIIRDTESRLPKKHLISRNVANDKAKVTDPNPAISIFNFHYATPPATVDMNYGLNKPIGDNETGFRGTDTLHYRMEGWEFILAGGALYNNLDYSFTVDYENGTFEYPDSQPGSGNPALRRQLGILKRFIEGFDFIRMHPDDTLIKGGLPENAHAYVLAEKGKQYAAYIFSDKRKDKNIELTVDIPKGKYTVEWINTLHGRIDKKESITHSGGNKSLRSPAFDKDVALKITTNE
ncbi:MAG: cellulase family glycosylhydrolase [Verrucomicrobia bacterium]|nr:cellulase family glycosylhydrolase [Verrucomicrobiota bacterium]MCF7708150.1 cellulase family glycosylhydrolase [Verrucomicrobiota bacterium]